MTEELFLQKTIEYMLQRGDRIVTEPGWVNIVYFEGLNKDLTLNEDKPDRWNDLRCIIMFDENGMPYFAHKAVCTTEPGLAGTMSENARKNGGVARVQLIQYRNGCKVGWHKLSKVGKTHPALVQAGQILVYRDKNRDMRRTGDIITTAGGINHHSTSPKYAGDRVGTFSEGCLVGWKWAEHLVFIKLVKKDPRYIATKNFAFDFTVIGADSLLKD